ncbi:hypothetical protein [Parapedobacter tibetensis]|uniref:hypothetical protein n=1 Tax=Parapedobacter tibetensis TaxID=2972951 RepID=UPI00214D7A08|nr:hypothetical protein [Parapedobacter tibetensis]
MVFCGSGDETIQEARQSEFWQPLTRLAHTLAYDAACLDALQPGDLSKIMQHVLVLTGEGANLGDGMEEMEPDFFSKSAEKVISLLPNAAGMTINGSPPVPARRIPRRCGNNQR